MARPKTEAATYTSMMVRLPEPMHEKFKAVAAKKRRSLNQQFLSILDEWLEQHEEKKPPRHSSLPLATATP
jgi:predicted HicB family RNase H-like nuclease